MSPTLPHLLEGVLDSRKEVFLHKGRNSSVVLLSDDRNISLSTFRDLQLVVSPKV